MDGYEPVYHLRRQQQYPGGRTSYPVRESVQRYQLTSLTRNPYTNHKHKPGDRHTPAFFYYFSICYFFLFSCDHINSSLQGLSINRTFCLRSYFTLRINKKCCRQRTCSVSIRRIKLRIIKNRESISLFFYKY